MPVNPMLVRMALLLATWVASVPASAEDGAIEINQAAALRGGVTPGDEVGFPVLLSVSARYVLTSNLVVSDEITTAVLVTADRVDIDLRGFSLLGPNECSSDGSGVACPFVGGSDGVLSTREFVRVRNGFVRGFGAFCIELGAHAEVSDVVASDCGLGGIDLGLFASVRRVLALENRGIGIDVAGSSRIEQSNASFNGTIGLRAGTNAVMAHSLAVFNAGDGVRLGGASAEAVLSVENGGNGVAFDGSASFRQGLVGFNDLAGITGLAGGSFGEELLARENLIAVNDGDGIKLSGAAGLIVGNLIEGNGGDGVDCVSSAADTGCQLVENLVSENAATGVRTTPPGGNRQNIFFGNNAGNVVGAVDLGGNLCSGGACP